MASPGNDHGRRGNSPPAERRLHPLRPEQRRRPVRGIPRRGLHRHPASDLAAGQGKPVTQPDSAVPYASTTRAGKRRASWAHGILHPTGQPRERPWKV